VLHLERDAVELGARHRDGAFHIYGSECNESGLTLLERFDYAV
jgi:hypothetical protein